MGRRVAAFDFDGTLSRSDCLVPFLARVAGRRRLSAAITAELPRLTEVARGRTSRDELKAAVFRRLLRDQEAARVAELGRAFAAEIVAGKLRPDALRLLDGHRERGHELVIVSASLQVYLVHVGDALGFDGVCAVELEETGGVLTGAMVGGNVRGPAKVRRLEQWLGEPLAGVELWAYGDSAGDADLLAAATHAVWMGRRRRRAATPRR